MKKAKKTKGKLTTPLTMDKVVDLSRKTKGSPPPKFKTKLRIPRPLGLTLMMKEYRNTNNKELLTNAKNMIINQWSTNNFSYNGKQYSIEDIAKLLDMPTQQVIKKVTQPIKHWLTNDTMENRYEALLSLLTKMGLATRAQIQGHVEVLQTSQTVDKHTNTYKYTPWVSAEVTNALKLILKSDENLWRLFEGFKPTKPSVAIQVNNQGADAKQSPQGNYLGINEAVKLLNATGTPGLLDNPEAQTKLLAEYTDNTELPEIIATKQQGISIDGSTKEITKRSHDKRREADGPIYSDVIIP